jgi:serine/threonine-protein kinase RsbW
VTVLEPLVSLSLPARPENVGLVRHAIAGIAEAIGLGELEIADLKTVVTEACMNVAVHAYGGEPGPLEVAAGAEGEGITVSVRDHGQGFRPRPALDEPTLRLGLPLIAALSTRFEIRGGTDLGTEVVMYLAPHGESREEPEEELGAAPLDARDSSLVAIEAGEFAGAVVSRVIASLAARADLSVDRMADAVLLGDAISAGAPAGFESGRLRLTLDDGGDAIDVRIGPLEPGAGERLLSGMELPGIGASLQKLADEVGVERDGDSEVVRLRIARR